MIQKLDEMKHRWRKNFLGSSNFFPIRGGGGIINTGGLVPLLYYYLINKSVYYQIDKSVFKRKSYICRVNESTGEPN